MIALHQNHFGQGALQSIATDKGCYAFDNERRFEANDPIKFALLPYCLIALYDSCLTTNRL